MIQWGTASTGSYKSFPLPFSQTIYSYNTTRKTEGSITGNGTAAVGTTSAIVSLFGITTYAREADGGEFRNYVPVTYLVIGI